MTTNAHHEQDDLIALSNGSGYLDRRGRLVPHCPLAQPLSGESYRLIACPSMFSVEKGRIDVLRPPGGSVADILRAIGWTRDWAHARVFIDGCLIPEARWEYTLPAARQSVCIRAIPMGGNAQGKEALRIVSTLAIIVASMATPYGLAALGVPGLLTASGGLTSLGVAASATTSIVGSTEVLRLLPARSES